MLTKIRYVSSLSKFVYVYFIEFVNLEYFLARYLQYILGLLKRYREFTEQSFLNINEDVKKMMAGLFIANKLLQGANGTQRG
jgi:hypothetical protein